MFARLPASASGVLAWPFPVVWPQPHGYADVHALARQALLGARYRRHPLWRYSLIWAKR
jgi:hypothetical protein